MTTMSEENARRLAERQQRDALKISVADVETYREIHSPGSRARRDEFIARGGIEVYGDEHIAKLSHERFHTWFGTECDDTCPHPREPKRVPWWKRLFGKKQLPIDPAVRR